jgi:proteasome lid subunit RPN8/RPN11
LAILSTPFRLLLPRTIYEEMIAHARAELPNECCGALAGKVGGPSSVVSGQLSVAIVERCYPLVNELASPTEFLSEPKSMFHAEKNSRQRGLEILAFYHSHPTSDPVPSRKDMARNYWGTIVMHLIISLKGDEPRMRGWWIGEESYAEAEWELIDDKSV